MYKNLFLVILSISLCSGQGFVTATAINKADEYTGTIVLVDRNCIERGIVNRVSSYKKQHITTYF